METAIVYCGYVLDLVWLLLLWGLELEPTFVPRSI